MAEEIGRPGAYQHYTVLADFLNDSGQSAGDKWEPSAKKLESDEVAEVAYMEIFSPIQADGSIQDLKQIIPVVDGKGIEEYISLSGRYDSNMAPAQLNQFVGPAPFGTTREVFQFGTPGVESPLANTTLKAKNSIGIRTFAGDGTAPYVTPIDENYRVRVYGVLYKTEEEIRRIFGDSVYGGEATLEDRNRNRRLAFTKDAVDITKRNWDMLVGGTRQSKPQVMPFVRYAYNAKATTANTNYEFNYTADEVDFDYEDMYFDFGTEEALAVSGFGVRSPDNLEKMGIKLGSDELPRPNAFSVLRENNPLHFGHGRPQFPEDFPMFIPIPTLKYRYVINNEKGRIFVRDNGTSVSTDDIVAALQGIKIELP